MEKIQLDRYAVQLYYDPGAICDHTKEQELFSGRNRSKHVDTGFALLQRHQAMCVDFCPYRIRQEVVVEGVPLYHGHDVLLHGE